MNGFVNTVFTAASLLTLSGLDHISAALVLRAKWVIVCAVLVLYSPLDLWGALLRKRQNGKSEAVFYAGLVLFGVLFLWLDDGSAQGVALLWMLVGGCERSLSGGFRVGPLLDSFKLLGSSVTLRTHPNAVPVLRRDGALLDREKASDHALAVIFYLTVHLTVSFLLSFGTASFSDAMLLSAAALGNVGWVLLLCTGSLPTCGVGATLFLALLMLAARVLWFIRRKRG